MARGDDPGAILIGRACPNGHECAIRNPNQQECRPARGARCRRRFGRPEPVAAGDTMSSSVEEGVPALLDRPIGISATGTRRETDSMGGIDVPADRYWGAQTERSLLHFAIGDDRMPKRVYHAYGYVKKAAALVNESAGRLPQWKADAIARAAEEAIAGRLG